PPPLFCPNARSGKGGCRGKVGDCQSSVRPGKEWVKSLERAAGAAL
ncbi:hypothetical protein HMPREF0262_02308, partial [Clostridium sp. ATCC 29733]